MTQGRSVWGLRYDVLSARVLLGLSLAESRGEVRPEVHRFLADRYGRLAAHWRESGWRRHATALERKAWRHQAAAGDDDLPPAASMAMPRRRRATVVDARGAFHPRPR